MAAPETPGLHGCSGGYLGPGGVVMKFKNFNLLKDPRIEASQYEDSFPDVGRAEMERRFSERRALFVELYDPAQPRRSLPRYMKAAQDKEGYRYEHGASSGLLSMFLGGSVPKDAVKGELPECQLLGFLDGNKRVGCMAHPLAETAQGHDGRDQVGFFHHSGCCGHVGCEASREFPFLSAAALKAFDRAVEGMSWYEFSRHSTSVLVYYLRSYDHIVQLLGRNGMLDSLTLEELVKFTNKLYAEWPLRAPAVSEQRPPVSGDDSDNSMDSLAILSTDIPLSERMLYIALDSRFMQSGFASQLDRARDCIESHVEALRGK